ncbi:MAG: hypothetical protein ACI4M9_02940, partial [Succinivibrio sp.]
DSETISEETLHHVFTEVTEDSDESASGEIISLYRELKAFGDVEDCEKDLCALIIRRNSKNKEFEEDASKGL